MRRPRGSTRRQATALDQAAGHGAAAQGRNQCLGCPQRALAVLVLLQHASERLVDDFQGLGQRLGRAYAQRNGVDTGHEHGHGGGRFHGCGQLGPDKSPFGGSLRLKPAGLGVRGARVLGFHQAHHGARVLAQHAGQGREVGNVVVGCAG